jgi:hypothetical protein
LARLAEATVRYADARIVDDRRAAALSGSAKGKGRAKPGEFVADELALMLREQLYAIRCLLARSRRLAADLPTVWEAFRRGELDLEQVRVIDRAARKVTQPATLAAIDDQAVEAAQTRTPKQLLVWLLRIIVQLEPAAFEERHRRALADRRVTVVQGLDGMGYVTGEVTAADAAAIDAVLAATARSLGADDPRTEQQRRADLFADLLLGRLAFDDAETNDGGQDPEADSDAGAGSHHSEADSDVSSADAGASEADSGLFNGGSPQQSRCGSEESGSDWLEVEIIDPDTGEVTIQLQRVDRNGEPVGEPIDPINPFIPGSPLLPDGAPRLIKRPRTHRIGIVVPIASLLGATDTPGELAVRTDSRLEHRPVLPTPPQRQNLCLASGAARPRWRRLDHGHRRPLSMYRPATTHRTDLDLWRRCRQAHLWRGAQYRPP